MASPPALQWTTLHDLPDPVGLKGAYAGVSDNWILLAGGSNFPIPRNQGGGKAFADRVYLRPLHPVDAPWQTLTETLPIGKAEGASVTLPEGVVFIGGQSAQGPLDEVTLFSWDSKVGHLHHRPLARLPKAVANCAAVVWDGSIFVAGGEHQGVSQRHLWMLPNLESPHWQELPTWPGPSRFGATLLVEDGKLFLFAGRTSSPGPAREEDYLQDAWRFDLNTHQWTPLASLPHRTMQAAGIVLSHTSMAVLGGSDGHDLPRMGELGERYRIPAHIAVYDLTTNRWTTAGDMPIGVVGAAVVPMENGWMIAGGEYSPTLRTASVFRLSTSVPATPKRGLTR